jgi:hypothetical protein
VDHAVDALFDPDEDAVIGERADLAADLVAGVVLVREEHPRIGLELLETEADALGARVHLEHLALDLLADVEELRGCLTFLVQLISLTWMRPSTPGSSSTKAP